MTIRSYVLLHCLTLAAEYAHAFDLSNITMPQGYEDYLEPVRRLRLVAGANKGVAYMTVDEKIIKEGMSQRRPSSCLWML